MREQKKPAWKEFEKKLIAKAMKDEAFRKELLQNPKGVLQKELDQVGGVKLPAELEVKVVEQPDATLVLVLPSVPAETLTDDELEQIAGGGFNDKCGCLWINGNPPFDAWVVG